MRKYIVAQTQQGSGCLVMERQHIGEVEVYVEFCGAETASKADQIAEAMNARSED